MEKSLISVVVPCYNEEKALPHFIEEIKKVLVSMEGITGEVIFVNDGSRDGTLAMIRDFSRRYSWVRFISFSRNFGKEGAILAGLSAAKGEWAAVMDADLQDPPSLLPEMLQAIREEGYECVGTCRKTRKGEPPIRSFFARCFYRFINCMSETKLMDGARDYKLLSRPAIEALVSMPEVNRFSKGLYEWIGFRTKWIAFENVERVAGETKWSFWRLFKYSIEGILSFSTVPLILSTVLGLLFMLASLISIVALSIRQFIYHSSVDGWTSLICVILLLSGVQLFCLGLLGQYMAKMYTEIKRRPHYIISESSN